MYKGEGDNKTEEINRLKDKVLKDNDLSDLEFIELLLTYSTRARKK